MDQFAQAIIQKRLETAAKALRANRMDAEILSGPQELLEKLRQLLPPKAIICSGGSMTLKETGVNDLLASGEYDFYYRGRTDENGEPIDVFRKAFSADWYFSSSNAITLNGELYNVDGNANRVAALTFGPEHVVIIAGAKRDKEETIFEISDLAYHVLVLMIELSISVEDITKEEALCLVKRILEDPADETADYYVELLDRTFPNTSISDLIFNPEFCEDYTGDGEPTAEEIVEIAFRSRLHILTLGDGHGE